MKQIIDSATAEELSRLLKTIHKAVITCHMAPDGDALGSSLALCRVLHNLGIEAKVCVPDALPRNMLFLPGVDAILDYHRDRETIDTLLSEADAIFCLDYNEARRTDAMADSLLKSQATKVMIDHHLHPDSFPEIIFSHPQESSTSILIYRVCQAAGIADVIDRDAAVCIYTGMMTDTGNFSYNANNPDIYLVIADLIERGVDKDAIYRQVYYSNTLSRLKLNAFAILRKLEVFPAHHGALITLTRGELNEFHYTKGDTEDLVNRPLTIPEITWSVFMREEEGFVKVSTRSKGAFPVNEMCKKYFGGGGHLNAAGGEFRGTLPEAVDQLKNIMGEFDKYLDK